MCVSVEKQRLLNIPQTQNKANKVLLLLLMIFTKPDQVGLSHFLTLINYSKTFHILFIKTWCFVVEVRSGSNISKLLNTADYLINF